jgi:hypothetical protein
MKIVNKNFFYFTKNERTGLIVLATIILLLLIFPFLISFFPEKDENHNSLNQYSEYYKYIQLGEMDTNKLFSININKSSFKELKKFGFSNSQSSDILNFIKDSGRINSLKQLNEIESIFFIIPTIENYIKFEDESIAIIKNSLNKASYKELIKIIDKKTTLKILSHRKELGGFNQYTQIKELINNKNKLDSLKRFFFIDKKEINRIRINLVSYNKLLRHPQFSKDVTIQLFKLKRKFVELDPEIIKHHLTKGNYEKIKDYIAY